MSNLNTSKIKKSVLEQNFVLARYRVLDAGTYIDAICLTPQLSANIDTYLVLQDDTIACCEVRHYKSNELSFIENRTVEQVYSMARAIQTHINRSRKSLFES